MRLSRTWRINEVWLYITWTGSSQSPNTVIMRPGWFRVSWNALLPVSVSLLIFSLDFLFEDDFRGIRPLKAVMTNCSVYGCACSNQRNPFLTLWRIFTLNTWCYKKSDERVKKEINNWRKSWSCGVRGHLLSMRKMPTSALGTSRRTRLSGWVHLVR